MLVAMVPLTVTANNVVQCHVALLINYFVAWAGWLASRHFCASCEKIWTCALREYFAWASGTSIYNTICLYSCRGNLQAKSATQVAVLFIAEAASRFNKASVKKAVLLAHQLPTQFILNPKPLPPSKNISINLQTIFH